MTSKEAISQAQKQGFKAIETSGGYISLFDWQPYGKTSGHQVDFILEQIDNDVFIVEVTPDLFQTPAHCLGYWKLTINPCHRQGK